MTHQNSTETLVEKIARQCAQRVQNPPFIFLPIDQREDAFQETLARTLAQFRGGPDPVEGAVEQAFTEHAADVVKQASEGIRREPMPWGTLAERGGPPVAPAGEAAGSDERSHADAERLDRERLLFVRMVVRRGFLPPDDALGPAARAVWRERGVADPSPEQTRDEIDRLRQGDLQSRKKLTRERLADISFYHSRLGELTAECRELAIRLLAGRMAEGMGEIRRRQNRSNKAKKGRAGAVATVALFAGLREDASRLSAEHAASRETTAGPDRDVVLGILATFEMFARLFPRADQLGRCLRLARVLAAPGDGDPVGAACGALRAELEAVDVLAKIHTSFQDRLAGHTVRLEAVAKAAVLEPHRTAALKLTVLWLRAVTAAEASRGHDDLPVLDAGWWLCPTDGGPEVGHVDAAVGRLYRTRTAVLSLNRQEF